MRSHSFYPIIGGFYPFDVPGVGTFYDFINLLMFRKPKEGRGITKRQKKDNGSKPHPGIIRRLADRLLEGKRLPLRFSSASIIKEIFDVVFVAHSKKLGLLNEALIISGDGSKLPTWVSPHGRVIYTKPQWDYRIHTPVPRDSNLFKSLLNGRSASERSNKRKKYDFSLLNTRTSGRKFWFFRVMLASMCQP